MAEHSVLSIDSLGESELDLLRDKLKQKDHIIGEKSEIIKSLREQVNDLNHDLEEMETSQQVLNQKVDRLTKDLTERDEQLEAVSHALKEVEAANENLTKRMDARTGQLQKFVEDLVKAKKDLEQVSNQNEELRHKNEQLIIELEMAHSRKRSLQEHEEQLKQQLMQQQQEQERLLKQQQQPVEYRPQIQSARYTRCHKERPYEGRLSENDENRPNELTAALHFPIADEIGEIMDSSSALPPRSFHNDHHHHQHHHHHDNSDHHPGGYSTFNKVKQEPHTWDHQTHDHRMRERGAQIDGYSELNQPQVGRQNQQAEHENYCQNHRQKRTHAVEKELLDPIAEYKMRVARANELARRNMQTKPLHQTSYPLELDTFDTTDFNEQEIKRGNVLRKPSRPPQRPPPQPPVPPTNYSLDSPPRQQQAKLRQALSNCSNTPPVRRVYKKAEAFIV